MEEQVNNIQNKDLILRERLAMERTAMANDTTLLAFIRTSLYFYVAGLSIDQFLHLPYGFLLEIIFGLCALFILAVGLIKYRKQNIKLKQSEHHLGNYKL